MPIFSSSPSLRVGSLHAFVFITLMVGSSCTISDDGFGSCESPENVPGGLVFSTACISATAGGVITLPARPDIPGSGSLVIPAGALQRDTQITVYSHETVEPGLSRFVFEPDGLVFSSPARLTVPVDLGTEEQPNVVSFFQSSSLNDEWDVDSEMHRYASFENEELNRAESTVSGDMHHFSEAFVMFGMQEPAYLVVDIPGRYLRPGDGLFMLTIGLLGGSNWYPGHVGMLHSVDKEAPASSAATVIESTLGSTDGVQLNPFSTFKSKGIYLGARHHPERPMLDTERETAVDFAVGKLFEGYAVGASVLTQGFFGWSCTSLLESAWEAADRGVMGTFSFWPSPVEMFSNTVPVTQMTVDVGDEIQFPVYDVVFSPQAQGLGFDSAWYDEKRTAHGDITATGVPEGASFTNDMAPPGGGQPAPGGIDWFEWTPQKIDIGQTYPLSFNLKGVATVWGGSVAGQHLYDITQPLSIHVRGGNNSFQVEPVPQGDNWLIYSAYVDVPEGATIVDIGLLDVATGEFPDGDVFPGQYVDSVEYGPSFDGSTQHGVSFWLRNDTPDVTLPPTDPKTFRVYVQWEQDEYLGPSE